MKGIAESHGGEVELASSEKGTTVSNFVPADLQGS